MIENRVRKLMNEEQRLNKQIQIANKHSDLADQVQERRDKDARHKEALRQAELKRIED